VFVRDAAADSPFTNQCNKRLNMVALSSSLQNVEALHDPALASWELYPLLSFRARSEFCSRRGPHSMTVSMYKVSVPIFVQFLTAQSECIDKAVAHIEAQLRSHIDAFIEDYNERQAVRLDQIRGPSETT
jgi:hypothetical protein